MEILLNPRLISESKRTPKPKPTKAPDWWNRLSKNQQERYAKKHPSSYLKDFIKKSDVTRKKKSTQDDVAVKRKSKAKSKSVFTAKKQAPTTGKFQKQPKKVKAAAKEKLRRKQEQKLIDDSLPTIKRSFTESLVNLANKVTHVSKAIRTKMSPASKENLSMYMDARKANVDTKDTEAGRLVANKVLMSVAQAAIGASVVASIASGVAPLAGTLAAAYLGFKDYRKSLEGTKHEPEPKEEGDYDMESTSSYSNDELVSESANDEDPVESLVAGFVEWLGNQDLDGISERIAQYAAIDKMDEDKWQPDTSMLDDEELDGLLTSESSITPRLTFRIASNLKSKPEDQRTQYDVMFADRYIGRVYSAETFASKSKRMWLAELDDGFNEAVYHSGKQQSEPFTIVKSGVIKLRNPTRFTFSECCSWLKHNIDKNFL